MLPSVNDLLEMPTPSSSDLASIVLPELSKPQSHRPQAMPQRPQNHQEGLGDASEALRKENEVLKGILKQFMAQTREVLTKQSAQGKPVQRDFDEMRVIELK